MDPTPSSPGYNAGLKRSRQLQMSGWNLHQRGGRNRKNNRNNENVENQRWPTRILSSGCSTHAADDKITLPSVRSACMNANGAVRGPAGPNDDSASDSEGHRYTTTERPLIFLGHAARRNIELHWHDHVLVPPRAMSVLSEQILWGLANCEILPFLHIDSVYYLLHPHRSISFALPHLMLICIFLRHRYVVVLYLRLICRWLAPVPTASCVYRPCMGSTSVYHPEPLSISKQVLLRWGTQNIRLSCNTSRMWRK
jgi:hypothetical protein